MEGIHITTLTLLSDTEKGATFEFMNSHEGICVLGQRHEGTVNGRHYHEGISPTKNPEVFILLRGEMEMYAKNLRTGEEMRRIVTKPSRVEIYPYIWHEITSLTDITFIELNSIEEHIADTKYEMKMMQD